MIGGINWLLVGLLGKDIFTMLGWETSWIAKLVYIVIGLSAAYLIFSHKNDCKMCDKGMSGGGTGGMKPM